MKKTLIIAISIVTILVLTGCQTFASMTKPSVVHDETVPEEQLAYLYIDDLMKVKQFDGQEVQWYNNSTVAIAPGKHSLICDFGYRSDTQLIYKNDIQLDFEAKTGWTYRLNQDTNLFLLQGVFEIIPSFANEYATVGEDEMTLIFKRTGLYAGNVLVYINEDEYMFPITKKEDKTVIVKKDTYIITSKLPIGSMSEPLEITADTDCVYIEIKPTTSLTPPKCLLYTPDA